MANITARILQSSGLAANIAQIEPLEMGLTLDTERPVIGSAVGGAKYIGTEELLSIIVPTPAALPIMRRSNTTIIADTATAGGNILIDITAGAQVTGYMVKVIAVGSGAELVNILYSPGNVRTILNGMEMTFVYTGSGWALASGDLTPAGVMYEFAGPNLPPGFLWADGAAVSRVTYSRLFAAIGTIWGVGDGSTTFNKPDHRAAAGSGVGTSTGYTQNETIALGTKYNDQLQGHSHQIGRYNAAQGDISPVASGYIDSKAAAFYNTVSIITDGTNGTPRTGNITRGKRIGVNYIVKY